MQRITLNGMFLGRISQEVSTTIKKILFNIRICRGLDHRNSVLDFTCLVRADVS